MLWMPLPATISALPTSNRSRPEDVGMWKRRSPSLLLTDAAWMDHTMQLPQTGVQRYILQPCGANIRDSLTLSPNLRPATSQSTFASWSRKEPLPSHHLPIGGSRSLTGDLQANIDVRLAQERIMQQYDSLSKCRSTYLGILVTGDHIIQGWPRRFGKV